MTGVMTNKRRPARSLATLLLALGVVACASEPVSITKPQMFGRYSTTEVQWGTGDGRDFWVVVRNNPYNMTQEELDRTVVDSIQNKITYMITNFTTTPGEDARRQYRVEFMFDPPDNVSGRTLCDTRLTLPPPEPQKNRTVVLGAFCLRDLRLTEARATSSNAPPGSKRYEFLYTQLIRSILPFVDQTREGRKCRPPTVCM